MLDTLFERIFALALGGGLAFHFSCVNNFLPKVGATLKIRAAVIFGVFSSFALAVCVLYPDYVCACTKLLLVALFVYEIAKWSDGLLLCEHYKKLNNKQSIVSASVKVRF